MVSDLRLENNVSWCGSGSKLCADVQRWALFCNCLFNVSIKRLELVEKSWRDSLPLPMLSCELWMFVKENPDRKKKYISPLAEDYQVSTKIGKVLTYCKRLPLLKPHNSLTRHQHDPFTRRMATKLSWVLTSGRKISKESLKGTLMQILKSANFFVFI